MKLPFLFLFLFFLTDFALYGQNIYQTITGVVSDNESETPLPGATVILDGSDPVIGTVSDTNGFFSLKNVPVGRATLKISCMGYESAYISNIIVNSARMPVLKVSLKEAYITISDIVVRPKREREKAINTMAVISARTFSVEETQRYAGGFDDPSRLASTFAGVTPGTMQSNEIVIRGNAAKGILWNVEGVEIPSPNHLAGLFSGAGIFMMFSTTMLANSDFMTAAFPAEYGNALSGVFDLKMRTGNFDRSESALQFNNYGLELSTEGPFRRGNRATYLLSFRYSTSQFLNYILPIESGFPNSKDLSFKLNFPTKKAGNFSFWSINGMGNLKYFVDTTELKKSLDSDVYEYNVTYNLFAAGVNNKKIIGNRSYFFSTISGYFTKNKIVTDYLRPSYEYIPVSEQDDKNSGLTISAYYNRKFNARHTNRTGVAYRLLYFNNTVSANSNPFLFDNYGFFVKSLGRTSTIQVYSQSNYNLNNWFTLSAGLHFNYFRLNNEFTPEPRITGEFRINARQKIILAYGKHSRIEPLSIYLMDVNSDGRSGQLNKNLPVTKAHHFVVGFSMKTGENTHLKIEPYYQRLFDIPVSPDSSFSMVNYKNDVFSFSKLIQDGTGTNMGVDLTVEHFLTAGFYCLFTSSFFNSEYTGGDGIERNTRYNRNFIFNALAGKEWSVRKNNLFSMNIRTSVLGGERYIPVDESETIIQNFLVYDYENAYSKCFPTSFYIDLSVNYRINKSKFTHSVIIQAKNILKQQEYLGHFYNYNTHQVEINGFAMVLPYVSYKIEF